MNKSKYSNSELRNMGECLIKCGDAALGTALLELAEYRSRERKLLACSRVGREAIAYATDPTIVETTVKNELAHMMAQKTIEDGLVTFSQNFDSRTNELIFQGEVTVLKGE